MELIIIFLLSKYSGDSAGEHDPSVTPKTKHFQGVEWSAKRRATKSPSCHAGWRMVRILASGSSVIVLISHIVRSIVVGQSWDLACRLVRWSWDGDAAGGHPTSQKVDYSLWSTLRCCCGAKNHFVHCQSRLGYDVTTHTSVLDSGANIVLPSSQEGPQVWLQFCHISTVLLLRKV